MSNLYLKSGYLNVPWIDEITEKNNISYIVIVGSRQIGKTYGTLKLMLDTDRRFILMRRTQTEVDFLTNIALNPFQNIDDTVVIKSDSKYTARIDKVDENDNKTQIGMVTSLKGIAKIRGFNGQVFTDLVFDEFIPENHVTKIRDEGDAFINALITISGNRELEGRKPLKVWLLANANNIDNPILEVMNLQKKFDQMVIKGQEYSLLKDNGIMIINAIGSKIITKRKNSSIFKIANEKSKVIQMAFENEFSYNDKESVHKEDLKQFYLICSVRDKFSVWMSRHDRHLHIYKYVNSTKIYNNNDRAKKEFLKKYPDIRNDYFKNNITFSDIIIKENFRKFIDVK